MQSGLQGASVLRLPSKLLAAVRVDARRMVKPAEFKQESPYYRKLYCQSCADTVAKGRNSFCGEAGRAMKL